MAAVVAHHHSGLWNRRPEPSFHISDIHFTGMMPSYSSQRTASSTPSLRNFPPPTTHMDISLPLFTANVLATSVPYQSGATFAYDSSVNPYNMQQSNMPQAYSMNYTANMSPPVSYAGPVDPQPLPTVREVRNVFALDGNHMVKSESASPVQSNPMFNDASYATECKRSTSEPAEMAGINFATDVDTLMKAIQAKQTTSPEIHEPSKVSQYHNRAVMSIVTDIPLD
jgi:hypothetical protein